MTNANPGRPNQMSEFFQYPTTDVLSERKHQMTRLAHLLKAITLNSLSPTNVELQIEMKHTCSYVESSIASVLDNMVRLSNGRVIPLGSIHRIEFLK